MAEEEDRRRWTQNRRFEFIEWKLLWEGQLNRSDLEDHFGISTPQASVDLRNYKEVAGYNIEYNSTEKGYLPTPAMRPRFLRVSADRLLLQLRAWLTGALLRSDIWFSDIPSVDMAPDIVRNVDAECLRRIVRAIRLRQAIEVHYQSLTSSRWRKIGPHALAFDGYRWHVRAWCCDREDFRDFVLTRIDKMRANERVVFDPKDDVEWNTMVVLYLCPHPGLNDEQSEAVQRDYGMENGCREIEVRLSMAYYFIMRMNLDMKDLPPVRAQICLQNLAEVDAAIKQARLRTQHLVSAKRANNIKDVEN